MSRLERSLPAEDRHGGPLCTAAIIGNGWDAGIGIARGRRVTRAPSVVIATRNPDFAVLYGSELSAAGHTVICTIDGGVSLDQVPASATDCLLFDAASLADWEWLATARDIPIPIVVVTGWLSPSRRYRAAARRAGVAALVLTPASPPLVSDVVRRVLAGERGLEIIPRTYP